MELAAIGATPKGGVNRQALTPEEAEARRLLVRWVAALPITPLYDAAGNLFLRLEGSNPALPPVLTGSHIDSQPTGGKFDGSFGVLAGLEALQAIIEADLRPKRTIEVVAWMNEEGSRFAPGMMGSEAFTSARSIEEILAVEDAAGVRVADALPSVLAATPEAQERPLGFPLFTFVEAHIEQGPELERQGKQIGVVTGIQGSRRFRVRVTGEEAHAGTTRRSERKDALIAAIAMVRGLDEAMLDPQDDVRFTVGLFEVTPNAPSVIPGSAYFSIDLRHWNAAALSDLGDQVEPICRAYAGPCTVEVSEIAKAVPLDFQPLVPSTIRAAAEILGFEPVEMYSAAGHDARQLHYVCPTGMIFVPCKDGLSHNELESAEPEDLYAGTCVLAEVLLQLAEA
jgi:N-carbamoyl-L-amino-acid hydrolase